MDELELNIGNYLSCNTNMKKAEEHIRRYFASKGLSKKCIENSFIYLKTLRSNIADLDKQVNDATFRFRDLKCTNDKNMKKCCFLVWGVMDSL